MHESSGKGTACGTRRHGRGRLLALLSIPLPILLATGCGRGPPGVPRPPSLPEGLALDVVEYTYAVRGGSIDAIAHSLDQAAPRWEGRIVHGLATWRVRWSWRSTMHEGTCRLSNVRVQVDVDVVVPEWQDREAAPRSVAEVWDSFEAALRRHEGGHRDIGFAAGAEVIELLGGLRTPDCVEMAVVARQRAREAVGRYETRNERYDRNTRFGQTQGAVWPPGGGPRHDLLSLWPMACEASDRPRRSALRPRPVALNVACCPPMDARSDPCQAVPLGARGPRRLPAQSTATTNAMHNSKAAIPPAFMTLPP